MEKEIKILSIGNSFSEDAQRYLYDIAESLGKKIHNVNLFIGGCSLERHYNNMQDNLAAYKIIRHGHGTTEFTSIKDALLSDNWDYVTLQQVSSGAPYIDTYRPYIKPLADYVREMCPGAKLLLHQTWSYGKNKLGRKYGRCRDMFSRIERAYKLAAEEIGADGIIPAGETMERLKARGLEVHCDGAHASHSLGRYALALTWYNYLFGEDGRNNTFRDIEGSLPDTWRKAAGECAWESIENIGNFYYDIITTHDIHYAENRTGYADQNPEKTLDLYLPNNKKDFPTFLYFHGGGFTAGDKEKNILPLAKYLTDRGIALASANYRMYPNATYPDYLWDGAAAVAWVKKHIGDYGGNEKLFVGGSSAGGYMSLMLCFDEKYLAFNEIKVTDIAGFNHDAGQPTTHFNVLRERGLDRRRIVIDEAAPLYHVGVADEYPPMLFTFASKDIVNRREQNELLISTMSNFGYDMSRVQTYTFEDSTHSSYVGEVDENGQSRYGKIVYDFIIEH